MPAHDHSNAVVTAENRFVEAPNGVRYAYRRFGTPTRVPPLLFLQHFRSNLDNWDPLLVDALTESREASSSTTPGLSSFLGYRCAAADPSATRAGHARRASRAAAAGAAS